MVGLRTYCDRRWIPRWWTAFVLAQAIGCGGATGGPETFPVTGMVTRDGRPLDGAVVYFTPTSADLGTAGAQAATDAEGRFDVAIVLDMGKATKRGLPAGQYRVTVTKLEAAPGVASLNKPPRNVLPAKYAAVQSTPLTATVTADGDNTCDFAL